MAWASGRFCLFRNDAPDCTKALSTSIRYDPPDQPGLPEGGRQQAVACRTGFATSSPLYI